MLYFEDFMEAIENLPSELNESLTNVRQLDLQAQNILDSLSETIQVFFENCRLGKPLEYEKNTQILNITREYERALIHCKEKREIVENIYNTYRKLVRKLDIELEKFRLELEADNSGITEQIEKKVQNALGRSVSMASKAERRRQRLRFQQSNHCKNSFSVRRRLVGPAFRAALKSACMRPVNSGGVSSAENINFSLTNDQLPLTTLDSISTPGSHIQESGFHRKSNVHSDGLIPLKSVDENSLSLDHQSNDSPYERNFDTAVNLPPNVITKQEEDSMNIQNTGSGFSSTILKTNPCLLQEVPVDAKNHAGIHDRMIRNTNSSSNHLFYDATETSLSDREKLNLTPRSSSVDTQITEDIGAPGWSTLTPNFSGNREKRRHPRRQDLTSDDLVKLEDSSICGLNMSPEDAFDDHVYEFDVDPKVENTTDAPDDDEDYKRYCICRDVSYGDMIACDAPDCPFEWFHYGCVNLTIAPKGRWFCPTCSKSITNKKNPKKSSSRK